jgi:RND family efflux transporter MFP subunit
VEAASDDVAGRTLHYAAEIAPRYSNVMAFRVGGQIIERTVRLGDRVHRGQVVARLDPADALKRSHASEAALAAAEHRLLFARQQLERDQAQFAQGLIATAQLEQTQDAFSAAAAARQQAADQLALARDTLGYQTLVAGHDGVILAESADTGQVVAAGQGVYTLAWSGDVDVIIDASAHDVGRISIGDPARVRLAALDRPLDAQVREIAPAADAQSRTYRVRLTLAEPAPEARLGMTGTATLLPQREPPLDPFVVPATALFHSGPHPALWVIRASDSTLELRTVEVLRYRERSALIAGNLRSGDRVVAAGVHTLHVGERVEPVAPLFAGDVPDVGDTDGITPSAGDRGGTP